MKHFQRYGIIALAGLALASCAMPQAMLFKVDVLQPKTFTLDAEDQNIAIVTTYKDKEEDSTVSAIMALGAARFIETANALEEGEVGAFTIPQAEYSGTSDKEYLEQLMMATGSGTLVIMKNISFGKTMISKGYSGYDSSYTNAEMITIANMDVYDAIADTTLFSSLICDTTIFRIPIEFSLSDQAINSFLEENDSLIVSTIGAKMAKHISNNWIEEEWMLINYPEETNWHNAYKNAMDFKWEEAIKTWMTYTENSSNEKAGYAAFNIAVACQMLGETDLAISWLTYGRRKYDFPEARQLSRYLHNQKKIME
ncbi:MAG: hypothetical protein IK041_03235 [Bacteroidales bacterium]|nr:hypothetical protein [Bacteroidales bacterium]